MGIEFGPGSLAGAVGLLGVGLAMIFPNNRWIGLLFVVAAVVVFFFDVRVTGWHFEANTMRTAAGKLRDFRWWFLGIGIISIIAFGSLEVWQNPPKSRGNPNTALLAKAVTRAVLPKSITSATLPPPMPAVASQSEENQFGTAHLQHHSPLVVVSPHIRPAKSVVPGVNSSRLAVTGIDFFQPDSTKPAYGIRIKFRNKGTIPANAPLTSSITVVSDTALSDSQISEGLERLRSGTYSPDIFGDDRAEVETDQEYMRDAVDTIISSDDLAAVRAGKKFLYIVWGMAYVDKSLGPKQYWLVDTVLMQSGDLPNYTVIRTRTVVRDAP